MNKFKAINYIRSSSIMSKPVKDTYEFRCNGVHFATITKSENGAYYVHRRNVATVVVSHFMQAVAELLPMFLDLYLDECKNVHNLRPSGYSKTLGEGLSFNIKNLEKTLKDIEKDIDETIKNL